MKAGILWGVVRFTWELNFVSTRLFCREVGIDRSWLQERIRNEGWQAENYLTLVQMEKAALQVEYDGRMARAAEIRTNIRIRRTAWSLAATMLRMMIVEMRNE